MIFSNPGAYSALSWFFEVLALAALIVEVWAFVDAMRRPSAAFPAAGKQTKPLWLIITGVATWRSGSSRRRLRVRRIGILPIAAFIAAAIYLTDVRPKVREFGGGGPARPARARTAPGSTAQIRAPAPVQLPRAMR